MFWKVVKIAMKNAKFTKYIQQEFKNNYIIKIYIKHNRTSLGKLLRMGIFNDTDMSPCM
jgi:hypothetical protein